MHTSPLLWWRQDRPLPNLVSANEQRVVENVENKRFTILILQVLEPRFVSGSLMGDPVVMLSLYPEFPQSVMSSVAACGEFVFLIDRSGSMDCDINNESMEHPIDNSNQQQTRIGSARVMYKC